MSCQSKSLPSREPGKVMDLLSRFNENKHYEYVESILGTPDNDFGSGIYVLEFKLQDGTNIIVGTPDKEAVFYIYRSGPGIRKEVQIYKKTEQDY